MIRLGIPFANDRKAEAVVSSEKVRRVHVVLSYIDMAMQQSIFVASLSVVLVCQTLLRRRYRCVSQS